MSIRVSGIRKSYGSACALQGVSLDIAQGEAVSLLGPAGSGKSTLIRTIAGLEAPDEGTVEVSGPARKPPGAAGRPVAMIAPSQALPPRLTLRRTLDLGPERRYPAWHLGLSRLRRIVAPATPDDAVRRTAELFGLAECLDRTPGHLTDDQRCRALFARALSGGARALLLDDPGPDPAAGERMRGLLCEVRRALGLTVVLATREPSVAMAFCDRLVVLSGGRVLQTGAPDAVYDDPDSLEVARLVGSPPPNLVPGEIDASGFLRIAGVVMARFRTSAPLPVMVGIRPEAVAVHPAARRGLPGTVLRREYLGSEVLLHVAAGTGESRIVAKVPPPLLPGTAPGAAVSLSVPPSDLLLFPGDGSRLRLPLLQHAELA